MSRNTVEQLLVVSAPNGATGNVAFVDAVMERVAGNSSVINRVALRNMNEQHKGGSIMNKLRSLSAGALIMVAIIALTATGGVVYAAYKYLWEPLQVKQGATTVNGENSKTVYVLSGCPSTEGLSQAEITAEVNKRSGISPEEAKKYIIAGCERNAVDTYVHALVAAKGVKLYDSSILVDSVPVPMRESLRKSPSNDSEVSADTNTKWIVNGTEVEQSEIKNDDPVFVVAEKKGDPKNGYTEHPRIIAIVKASVDIKYYQGLIDPSLAMVQHKPCQNNATESCADTSGYLVYSALPDTGPDDELTPQQRRLADAVRAGKMVQFQGKVTNIDTASDTYTIETSTGRIMTFSMPSGLVKTLEARGDGVGTPKIGSVLVLKTVGTDRTNIPLSDLVFVENLIY